MAYRNTLGWLPGMNNLGQNAKGKRTARADDIDIKIYESDDATEPVSEGHGSWLSHMIIDEDVLWKIEDPKNLVTWKKFGEYVDGTVGLVSDTSQRIDVEPIKS